jgi:hypothetical protein
MAWYHYRMPKRKTAETNATESAAAEPVKRRTAATPKTAAAATHKRPSKKAVPTPSVLPTSEQIALRAYLYWEQRGYQGGSPEEDWLRAERELTELA